MNESNVNYETQGFNEEPQTYITDDGGSLGGDVVYGADYVDEDDYSNLEETPPTETYSKSKESYLAPQIDHISFSMWTRDQILNTSVGEIKTKVDLTSRTESPDDKIQGLFDWRIFGHSPDSLPKDATLSVRRSEEKKRMSNWGHIQLPMPVLIPGLVDKKFLSKLLGVVKGGDALKSVINMDAEIARVKSYRFKGTPEEQLIQGLECTDDFIKENEKRLKLAAESGYVKILTLDNQYGRDTKNGFSQEKIFIIDRKLFNVDSKTVKYGHLNARKYWCNFFQVLPGGFAIMDLLSRIDVDKEISYVMYQCHGIQGEKIKAMQKLGILSTNQTLSVSQTKKLKSYDDAIQKYYTKYEILLGFKKQGTTPTDLVTDVIPVQPAHWRDRTKVVTNGQTKYTQDALNTLYNNILDKIEFMHGSGCTISYEDMRGYQKADKNTYLRVRDALDHFSLSDSAYVGMAAIQKELFKYLLSSKDIETGGPTPAKSLLKRFSEKTANNRAHVLGKRLDYTARSVITGDQTLYLDEIGVPYDILKVHFKTDICRYLKETKGMNPKEVENIMEHLGDNYDNPISVNDLSPGYTVSYEDRTSTSKERDIYEALTEILKTKRYLAIRYPSLHKWNELGYRVRIVYDQTIHLNPLVCEGYNADFDGDQMSICLATLLESIIEIDNLLLPVKNDMDANGNPMMKPGQDMVMGLYILTLKVPKDYENMPVKGYFSSVQDLRRHIELGDIDLHDKVSVLMPHYLNSNFKRNFFKNNIDVLAHRRDYSEVTEAATGKPVNENVVASTETMSFEYEQDVPDMVAHARRAVTSTAGRFIFNEIIPQDLETVKRNPNIDNMQDIMAPENFVLAWDTSANALDSKTIGQILKSLSVSYSSEVCAFVKDKFKSYGYQYITESGLSLSLLDINVVSGKEEAINECYKKLEENKKHYVGRELSEANIKVWEDVDKMLAKRSLDEAGPENPIIMMAVSGARGKLAQIKQIGGMRGIMMDATNKKIETPIIRSFIEGLDPLSYMMSALGACKGMIDRSRRTADTGDLARHLTYGNSSQVITDGDCGDTEGMLVTNYVVENASAPMTPEEVEKARQKIENSNKSEEEKAIDLWVLEDYKSKGSQLIQLREEVIGKNPVSDIEDIYTGEVLFKANRPIYAVYYKDLKERLLKLQVQYGDTGVRMRSVFTCKCPTGTCARCYGYFYAGHAHAKVGDAVGQVTAQALSERATQLTMRTFHTGGIAQGDISAGFDRISSTIMYGHTFNPDVSNRLIPMLSVCTREIVQKGISDFQALVDLLADPSIRRDTLSETINGITYRGLTLANFGYVQLDLCRELFEAFVKEVRDPFLLNEINFKRVHFEIVATQAMSNLKVIYSPDSTYRSGEIIKSSTLIMQNLKLAYEGKRPILAAPILTGYKSLVVDKNSPLTGLFFQNAGKVLSYMSLVGAEDKLTNPIAALGISNTMPLGEGSRYYKDTYKSMIDSPAPDIKDYVAGFNCEDINDVSSFMSLTDGLEGTLSTPTGNSSKPVIDVETRVEDFPEESKTVEDIVEEESDATPPIHEWEEQVKTVEDDEPEHKEVKGIIQGF